MPRARMDPDVKARLLAVTTVEADRRSGRHLVVERVRRWIFEGHLRDGDVISQEDLAEILGTSRIPIRDGLISLEHGGWVIIEPGIGARAVDLDAAAVRDSFDLLGHIWCLLIRRVVERKAETKAILTAAERVARTRTAIQMTAANQQFVTALRSAAHAPRLDAAFQNAGRIVPGDFFATVPHAMSVHAWTSPRWVLRSAAGRRRRRMSPRRVPARNPRRKHRRAVAAPRCTDDSGRLKSRLFWSLRQFTV